MQASEPTLASNLYSTVLAHDSIEKTLAFLLGNKLSNMTLLPTQLMTLIKDVYEDDPDIVHAALADLQVSMRTGDCCGAAAWSGLVRCERLCVLPFTMIVASLCLAGATLVVWCTS